MIERIIESSRPSPSDCSAILRSKFTVMQCNVEELDNEQLNKDIEMIKRNKRGRWAEKLITAHKRIKEEYNESTN